jgi:hypothetical protein
MVPAKPLREQALCDGTVATVDPFATDPELHRRALILRLERERARDAGIPTTEAIGGWTQIGVQVERLLRANLAAAGARCGRSPEELFRAVARDGWTLDRASAGQMLYVWKAVDPAGSATLASVLSRLIERRNVVVHGRGSVDPAARADIDAALAMLTSLTGPSP